MTARLVSHNRFTELREPPGLRLPVNILAEQALLGSLLVDNVGLAEACGVVTAEDFSETTHQWIFASIVELVAAGQPANPVTMGALFNADAAAFPGSRPARYLMQLADSAVTCRNNRHLAVIIADLAQRRRLMADLENCRPLETAYDVIDRHRNAIDRLRPAQR